MTDSVPYSETAMYASGAGLGASKGKEISKIKEGYGGYLQMAQDAVRLAVSPVYVGNRPNLVCSSH